MSKTLSHSHPAGADPKSACARVNVLAYVQMRNIFGSTGAGRVACQLTEHLARRPGVNLHILADKGDYGLAIDRIASVWKTFEYHLFEKDTTRQQRQWLLLRRPVAERYWPEAQIVHCMGESYVPTSHSRLVVTVHDAAYFDHGAHPRNLATFKQSVKWRLLYSRLSRTADAFHTVSNFSADRLGHIFPSIRSRLCVIHNAVSPQFFAPDTAANRDFISRKGLDRRPYVLLPGGLQYRKNADLVLNAWPVLAQRMPELMLVVSGHCDPQLAKRALALGRSVILTGFVQDAELRELYGAARVVWFPSRYEGFGMPVLEAMASGGPVVASNSTSIPEVAGNAAVLTDPQSIADNVESIETVIRDGRLRSNLIERGRARAGLFTWTASAAKLHELYSRLA